MQQLKDRFPWRFGATSYVIPADILPNVELVAGLVDDVQLLFFESSANAQLPRQVPVLELREIAAEHELTYTVHLPTDIALGHHDRAVRQQGIDEIERLVALLDPLAPLAFDLHLPQVAGMAHDAWLDCVGRSLAALAARLGSAARQIAIENIDYPFGHVAGLVTAHGFSVCLDLGHVLYYQHHWPAALASAPRALHLHLHGMREGRDHRPLDHDQAGQLVELGHLLWAGGFGGVITLEVYQYEYLRRSCAVLAELWRPFGKESC